MARTLMPIAGAAIVLVAAITHLPPQAEEIRWLEYDAEVVVDAPIMITGPFALFARYHVDAERIAIELIHAEPGWNPNAIAGPRAGHAIYSDARRFQMIRIDQDSVAEVRKPVRTPTTHHGMDLRAEDIALVEQEMQDRLAAYRDALLGRGRPDMPVDISRDAAGRVSEAVWPAEDAYGQDATVRNFFEYDPDHALQRITAHAPQVAVSLFPVPADSARATQVTYRAGRLDKVPAAPSGFPQAAYRAGGRETVVEFGTIAVNGGTLRLPVHIEERRRDNGRFVQRVRYHGHRWQTLGPGEAPPWERWDHARRTAAESEFNKRLSEDRLWMNHAAPGSDQSAFIGNYLVPLDELEATHEHLGYRLRAFRHAYMAAMILRDEAYLRAGFPWYMEQLAALESPAVTLYAGQDCLRFLMRWGYDGVVEGAFPVWRAAVNALDGPDLNDLTEAYAQGGSLYYAYNFFARPPEGVGTAQRFQAQYHRCMVLRRLGTQGKDAIANLGGAPAHWATMSQHEWVRMVADETRKADELYASLARPTVEQRLMNDAIAALRATAERGEGFNAATGVTVSTGTR